MRLKVIVLLLLVAGCASDRVLIAPEIGAGREALGPASGGACGTMLLAGYSFIPLMYNSRVERAYRNAVASVPGATALKNVEFAENWIWWYIGTTRCVTVTGEAVR